MKLNRTSEYSNSAGLIGANQYAAETWEGEINGKQFTVELNSCAAPQWSGADLDEDERIEVMNELSEKSGM